jgi:glycine betaine/proline transport system permease protein
MDFAVLLDPFQAVNIPLGEWASDGMRWLTRNYRDVFQAIKVPVKEFLDFVESALRGAPQILVMAFLGLLGWQVAGRATGVMVVLAMIGIGLIGAWDPAMTSFALLFCAVAIATVIGVPLGIAAAKSDRFWLVLRPILDLMQTIPSFTYLVPVILLLGVGNVPGVIVTAFYAMPPLIRLTNLGIREVRDDLIEAADAFGTPPLKRLFLIELPLARPTIMAGLNQTVMLSLAMSVIASMISVAGLGRLVLIGIGQLDMARASVGGVGIVLLAIVFDRITQGFGRTRRDRGGQSWREVGPVGWVRERFGGTQASAEQRGGA